jgi:hypothetical protein
VLGGRGTQHGRRTTPGIQLNPLPVIYVTEGASPIRDGVICCDSYVSRKRPSA